MHGRMAQTTVSLQEETVRAFLGRHYDDHDPDTAGIREMRNCLEHAAAEVHRRNQEAEIAWALHMGLLVEFEAMFLHKDSHSNQSVPRSTLGQSHHEIGNLHSLSNMLSSGPWGIQSSRPATGASMSSCLTMLSSVVCVDTENPTLSSHVIPTAQSFASRHGVATGRLAPSGDATPTRYQFIARVPAVSIIADWTRHLPPLKARVLGHLCDSLQRACPRSSKCPGISASGNWTTERA